MSTAGCLTSSSYDLTASHPSKRFAKLSAVSADRDPTATIRCPVCAARDSAKVEAILPGPMMPQPSAGASSGDSVRGAAKAAKLVLGFHLSPSLQICHHPASLAGRCRPSTQVRGGAQVDASIDLERNAGRTLARWTCFQEPSYQ